MSAATLAVRAARDELHQEGQIHRLDEVLHEAGGLAAGTIDDQDADQRQPEPKTAIRALLALHEPITVGQPLSGTQLKSRQRRRQALRASGRGCRPASLRRPS